jgi:hypothetical protein
MIIPLNKPDIAAREIFDFLANRKRYDIAKENCQKSAIKNSWDEEVKIFDQLYYDLETSS